MTAPGPVRARRGTRGSNSLELAIILPVVLLVVFGAVQLATWHHADNTVRAAASACAERARGYDHGAKDGIAAAWRVLGQVHGVDQPQVTANDDGQQVECVVTGLAPVLIPIGRPAVTQTVVLPKERVT